MTGLIRPNKYYFLGDADTDKISSFYKYLRAHPPSYPPEIEKSDGIKKHLSSVLECVKKYGYEKMIDFSKRLPTVDNFHFFNKEEFEKLKTEEGSTTLWGFSESLTDDMIINFSVEHVSGLAGLLSVCDHELIHQISQKDILIKGSDYYEQRTWFGVIGNKFKRFDEAITEITNREIILYYWTAWPGLAIYAHSLTDTGTGGYITPLIDWLIMEIAERNKKSYRWLLNQLQLDMFLGTHFGTRILTASIGEDNFRLLGETFITKYSQEIELAKTLGIPGVINNLTDFANGVKKPYLEGLKEKY